MYLNNFERVIYQNYTVKDYISKQETENLLFKYIKQAYVK